MSVRRSVLLGLLLLAVVPAACSDADDRAAPTSAGGSSAGRGFANAAGHEAFAGDSTSGGAVQVGGAASDGGVGNVAHLGGLGPVNSGGSAAVAPPQCEAARAWVSPRLLAGISTPGSDETLLALTHDELTLVFSRDTALLFVADRSSSASDFGAPVSLSLPVGYTHQRGLGLSADGLRLVMVSEMGDALAELRRAERGGAFIGPPNLGDYAAVNDNAYIVGAYLSSPVLAEGDDALYYALLSGDDSLVFRAEREALFVPPSRPEGMSTLGGTDGQAKLPHSVSADERSIFFFDEAKGNPVGLWRTRDAAPFYDPVDFLDRQNVFVNGNCDRLYTTREASGSLDVFTETPQ